MTSWKNSQNAIALLQAKQYLESIIPTMAELYRMYKTRCARNGGVRVTGKSFARTSTKWSCMSLFSPCNGQCDSCVSHEVDNISDKDWAANGKEGASKGRERLLNVRVRAIKGLRLLWPACIYRSAFVAMPASISSVVYYKQKLRTHNSLFSTWPQRKVMCYVWHEGEGGLTDNWEYMPDPWHSRNYAVRQDATPATIRPLFKERRPIAQRRDM